MRSCHSTWGEDELLLELHALTQVTVLMRSCHSTWGEDELLLELHALTKAARSYALLS